MLILFLIYLFGCLLTLILLMFLNKRNDDKLSLYREDWVIVVQSWWPIIVLILLCLYVGVELFGHLITKEKS